MLFFEPLRCLRLFSLFIAAPPHPPADAPAYKYERVSLRAGAGNTGEQNNEGGRPPPYAPLLLGLLNLILLILLCALPRS